MRNIFLGVLLSLTSLTSLTGCPGGTAETDTGVIDTGVIDAPRTDTPTDAPIAVDAPSAMDAPSDAPEATDAPEGIDAPAATDGGRTATCAPGPCPPECFVPNRCVATCGGPEINCGCCGCGEGSVNVATCAAP